MTLHQNNALTPAYLSGLDVVFLVAATGPFTSMAPLTAAEQAALRAYVLGGGGAIILTENSDFTTANASLLAPFGVATTSRFPFRQTGTFTSPFPSAFDVVRAGPGGTATGFSGWYSGRFTALNGAVELGRWGPGLPSLLGFAPGALGPGSGAVLLFADSGPFFDAAGAYTPSESDRALAVNSFALTQRVVSTPEPATATLLVAGVSMLGGVVCRRRGRRQRVAVAESHHTHAPDHAGAGDGAGA
jgi:hypothetical protein